ncbi:12098_t:CDS:2, partial [Gigaspora rosea]
SSTTDNLLIMYETILNKLLETHTNDFDMEDVHLEITNKIPIDNIVACQSNRAIKSHKDSLWSLVTKLLSAFNDPNPATHYLFKDALEINENGININKILSFYKTGKSRFEKVLAQDVYKTESRVASGCRSQDVNTYTYAQLESAKKQRTNQVSNLVQESTIQQNASTSLSETSLQKQTHHITSEPEKAILAQLFDNEENLSETIVTKVF